MKTMIAHSKKKNGKILKITRELVFGGVRYKFDSKPEMQRGEYLLYLEKAGKITNLRMQVPFRIIEMHINKNNQEKKIKVDYIADFVYTENNQEIIEDVKSDFTIKQNDYIIKKKMFLTTLKEGQVFREHINNKNIDWRI